VAAGFKRFHNLLFLDINQLSQGSLEDGWQEKNY
jgi:hypothetical protein